jgi:hypothetical protein
MNARVEQRIARVARERGLTFREAASVLGRRGARVRQLQSEASRLTAVRKTWAWKKDFET